MPVSRVYFLDGCLKIVNEDGDEMSLAGDRGGTSLALFAAGKHELLQDEVFNLTPEELLNNLAGHLGYKVVKGGE